MSLSDLKLIDPFVCTDAGVEEDEATIAAIEAGIRDAEDALSPVKKPGNSLNGGFPNYLHEIRVNGLGSHSRVVLDYTSRPFLRSLFDHVNQLRSFPYAGGPSNGPPGTRILYHSPFRIYYQIRPKLRRVDILHVWHGRRRGPYPPNSPSGLVSVVIRFGPASSQAAARISVR